MKYLKLFESLENIRKTCKEYNITNYTINSDGSIDVDGNVYLQGKKLTKLPLKFRNVSGGFYCNSNNLTNLEGSPINVGGNFDCRYNNLTSLEGAPNSVVGIFNCSNNKLTNLEGGPIYIGCDFNCDYNSIMSLEGAPASVGGNFHCYRNRITCLEGFPLHIGGGIFNCTNNPVDEIWKLFEDKSKIELFNYYDIIRGTDIAIDRLNDFLITIGKDPVESVKGYNNI